MPDPGEQLLFTLSAWDVSSWGSYTAAFDQIFLAAELSAIPRAGAVSIERWRALSTLAALGHAERGPDDITAVLAAPPVLARLPSPGMPRALLCGRRAPQTLAELREASRDLGARVTVTGQARQNRYAPSRIQISASDEHVLQSVADRLSIVYEAVPPAWTLAAISGSVDEYMAQLNFERRAELGWKRTDFSPTEVRFTRPRAQSDAFRLSRYRNPTTGTQITWLWHGDNAVDADVSWARYVSLQAADEVVLHYDERHFTFDAPWGAPLPAVLARALTLCTGEVATEVPPGDGAPGHYRYAGVPPDVAAIVLEKTGQVRN